MQTVRFRFSILQINQSPVNAIQSLSVRPYCWVFIKSLLALFAVRGALALYAVFDDPRVLLDLLKWDSLLRVQHKQLRFVSTIAQV